MHVTAQLVEDLLEHHHVHVLAEQMEQQEVSDLKFVCLCYSARWTAGLRTVKCLFKVISWVNRVQLSLLKLLFSLQNSDRNKR